MCVDYQEAGEIQCYTLGVVGVTLHLNASCLLSGVSILQTTSMALFIIHEQTSFYA